MDHREFDELVARLTSAPSRRDALKGIFGGALAAVGVDALSESGDAAKKGRNGKKSRNGKKGRDDKKGDDTDAEGKRKRRRRRRRKNKKCKPQPGQTRCSKKVCVDLQTSFANCGNCGNSCLTGQFCKQGSCRNAT